MLISIFRLNPILDAEGVEIPYDCTVTAHDNPNDWGRVYFRPYVHTFVRALSRICEVVIFTAACKEYADQILDALDPNKEFIHHRLYRESCQECQTNSDLHPDAKVYVKDLRILGRDLSKLVLLDNSLFCLAFQPDSGIVVNPFKGDREDDELIQLLDTLTWLERSVRAGVDARDALRSVYALSGVLELYRTKGRFGVKVTSFDDSHSFLTDSPALSESDDVFDENRAMPNITPAEKPRMNMTVPSVPILSRLSTGMQSQAVFTPQLPRQFYFSFNGAQPPTSLAKSRSSAYFTPMPQMSPVYTTRTLPSFMPPVPFTQSVISSPRLVSRAPVRTPAVSAPFFTRGF